MNIEAFITVAKLHEERSRALNLLEAAKTGSLGGLHIWHNGDCYETFDIISNEPVRQAVIEAAIDLLVATNKRLADLGVRTPPFDVPEMDAAGWRRTAEMYLRAWLRELGGKLYPKSHLIDALVLTTQEMKKRADAFGPPAERP